MTTAESLNYAKRYLQKAEEYLASAQDNLDLECATPAAGDAIHAGISAKDAIVTMLTGATSKTKDHAKSSGELHSGLDPRLHMPRRTLRELITIKGDVEYGTTHHAREGRAVCTTRSDARRPGETDRSTRPLMGRRPRCCDPGILR